MPFHTRVNSCLSGQSETESHGPLSPCGLAGMGIWDAPYQGQTVPTICDDDIQDFLAVSKPHLLGQGVWTML